MVAQKEPKMSIIYEPKGRAREYSPLAANLYLGCDHGCRYCYAPSAMRQTFSEFAKVWPRKRIREALAKDAAKHRFSPNPVLLSFIGDPYCRLEIEERITRHALEQFLVNHVPATILTKGGERCLRDLGLFSAFGPHIRVGATLTFWNRDKSAEWEPSAADPQDRIATLMILREHGIRTWASMEPVLDPDESLNLITAAAPYVAEFKLGKLNHDKEREDKINWPAYLSSAVSILRDAGCRFYVKRDLREAAPEVDLMPAETDMDALNAPGWEVPRL